MEEFKISAEKVKSFKNVSQDDKLILYGLYKQILCGNAGKGDYGLFDFRQKHKHYAWSQQKNKPLKDAIEEYVNLVDELSLYEL